MSPRVPDRRGATPDKKMVAMSPLIATLLSTNLYSASSLMRIRAFEKAHFFCTNAWSVNFASAANSTSLLLFSASSSSSQTSKGIEVALFCHSEIFLTQSKLSWEKKPSIQWRTCNFLATPSSIFLQVHPLSLSSSSDHQMLVSSFWIFSLYF